MLTRVFFLLRRFVAIALGLALTGYSAWASWSHAHDILGPLAAVSAAILLAFCERAWRDRQFVRFGMLGILGIAAAVISGSVVLERVSVIHTRRVTHAKRSDNLPRLDAQGGPRRGREGAADGRGRHERPSAAPGVAPVARLWRLGRRRRGNGSRMPGPSWWTWRASHRQSCRPRDAGGLGVRPSSWPRCSACPCGWSWQPPLSLPTASRRRPFGSRCRRRRRGSARASGRLGSRRPRLRPTSFP